MYFPSSLVALASLFAPPVGAWLVKKSIIFPFLLAVSLELGFYPLILAFPETLNHTSCSQSSKMTVEDPMIIAQDHQQKQTRASQRASTNACPIEKIPQDSTLEASWLLTAKLRTIFCSKCFLYSDLVYLKIHSWVGRCSYFPICPQEV